MDLIDREQLMNYIRSRKINIGKLAHDVIMKQPSIQLQESKTGKWIDKFAGVYRCSCCRETIEIDTEIDYPNGITFNYCPNCGANMVEP